MKISLSIVLLSSLLFRSTIAQVTTNSDQSYEYNATPTNIPPRIDGVLDDACWIQGNWQGNFVQQQPNEGEFPSSPTQFNILYDMDFLYVAFRCYDMEPKKVRHILSGRDRFAGDMTGIALDSYNDNKTAFEFNLSAAGQKVDLKHKGDFEFDMNWNAVWEGKTALSDSGWTAEMRIPFSQLRYTEASEQKWGLHIWRWIDRKNEESQWKLIPINAPAMVYLFGELNGIENIRSSRQLELLPYAVAKYAPKTGDQVNPYGNTREFFPAGGFDAKLSLSSNFTLDATINPDFGQVEADPSILNLTAFETFYDEKRPFFLEGQEIFDYGIDANQIYYSRRIGQAPGFVPNIDTDHYLETPQNSTILGAAKITGKSSGGLSVGIMESLTSAEYSQLYRPNQPEVDTLAAPLTNYLVARVMQEKNKGNTIFGGIITSTNRLNMDSRINSLAHKEAYTGGVDFEQNFANKTYFVDGKFLVSQLVGSADAIQNLQESTVHNFQRPGVSYLENRYDTTLTQLSGTGGYISGGKKGGKWRFSEKISWLSPGFNLNDIGYIRQADVITQASNLEFRENEPHKFSRNYTISLYQTSSYSFGGELVNSSAGAGINNNFHNLWGVRLNWNADFPSFESRELRGGPALWVNGTNEFAVHLNSNSAKDFNFHGGVHFEQTNNEPSQSLSAHLEVNWYPVSRIHLSPFARYAVEDKQYQYINTIEGLSEARYLMGSLNRKTLEFTLRAELFINPELSIQFYGSPYYSTGNYSQFYYVNQADSKNNSNRYHSYTSEEISALTPSNTYEVIEDNTGNEYNFENPDFMFGQLRTNLVFRWEYKLGSTFYVVWSHNQTSDYNINNPELSDNFESLNTIVGSNIFLLKLNYWFSI